MVEALSRQVQKYTSNQVVTPSLSSPAARPLPCASLHCGSEVWENIHLGFIRDHEGSLFVSHSRNAD